ncbi:MAG: NUDIX domain-containing protein [Nanoarchaeota archaeon]|nr:NUDIX domain-containing protein [Nanoarchaeota archaeon]
MDLKKNIRCVLHGSFRKHFDKISETAKLFKEVGIEVIAPEITEIVGETDGFAHLASDRSTDPRVTELLYLKKISELGPDGFSYYINPDGTLGTSASYELAIDQLTNTRHLFMEKLSDHPAYAPQNSVWKPRELADYISENGHYPPPIIPQDERYIYGMVQDLALHGSIIAVGAIIVDNSSKRYKKGQEREVLMVQTHKWGDRFSMVGGKVRRNERLADALKREVCEETGLEANIKESICTFDEIRGGGYFIPGTHRVFTDNVVIAGRRRVALNDEAQSYLWVPPSVALQELDIEPNAKITLELYAQKYKRIA